MSKIYAVVSYWGWPILGGGEQFLADTMIWAKEMGLKTIWICFANPTSSGPLFFEHTKIQSTSYGNVIQVKGGYTNEKLIGWLGKIRPRIVHHQGHFRNEMMRVCQELKIPFISGIHFWTDIIDLDSHTSNKDILKYKEKHKTSPKFKEVMEGCSILYACSDFVVDVIKTITDSQLKHVLYPISNETRIKCTHSLDLSQGFVTMINIHELKGGQIFLYCVENLLEIPFLGIQTEPMSLDIDNKIKMAIERRNIDENAKNCILMQRTEDIKAIYSQTKILMIPSLVDETFCKVAQEGLCNGIPIISSSRGYLPYMLNKVGVIMKTLEPQKWADKIKTLYHSEKTLKVYSQRARSRYLEKYSEETTRIKFKNLITSCLKTMSRIAIFAPWADQGLGIQAKNYAKIFLEMEYIPFIFSFRSYFSDNIKYQKDQTEWEIAGVNVFYSPNNRENVTDEEMTKFITDNDIRFLIIPETCFFRVFQIAQLAQKLGVRTLAIPNIETVRTSEIDQHKYFDNILCNNMFTYNIFRKMGFDTVSYIGYSLSKEHTPPLINKEKQEKGIKFLCICGLNSIVRKQAYLVLEAFRIALKRGLSNSTLTLTIQGSQIPSTDLFNDPRINIIKEHLPGKEIDKLYKTHNIFIQVSKHEGLGLGFHESLSYGLPVITLDTPPHNEIVSSDCGWFVDCKYEEMKDNDQGIIKSAIFKAEDLANCFLKAEREYSPDMNIQSRESYMSRYNKNDFIEKFRKIIELM